MCLATAQKKLAATTVNKIKLTRKTRTIMQMKMTAKVKTKIRVQRLVTTALHRFISPRVSNYT